MSVSSMNKLIILCILVAAVYSDESEKSNENIMEQEAGIAGIDDDFDSRHQISNAINIENTENDLPRDIVMPPVGTPIYQLIIQFMKRISDLEKSYDTLRDEVDQLRDENAALKSDVTLLNDVTSGLEADVNKLQIKVLYNREINNVQKKEISEIHVDLSRLQAENAAVQNEVDELRINVTQHNDDNSMLIEEVNQLQGEMSNVKQGNALMAEDIVKLEVENAALRSEMSLLEQNSDQLHGDVTALQAGDVELRNSMRIVQFYARLSAPTTVQPMQTVRFNMVLQDNGANYDSSSGRFTCPVTGTYAVNARITTRDVYANMHLTSTFGAFANLRLRGYDRAGAHPYSVDGAVFLYCQLGQQIWLENHNGFTTTLDNLSATFFTISLVQKDING